jgi:serine/threonine protein kinase
MSGDGKSTVVDRPDPDAKPTAVDRPATPHAAGSIQPQNEPERRSARRSIPPGARYQSGDEIGRGGMGRVVEATDTLLDRRVAVKEALTTDAELLRRFARETKITARLEHPSIVPVYDAGVADGSPFYVMRRVTGRPLSELIRAAPSLEERLALVPHLLAAAQAIAHAHQRGIIHRDIKPSNILVGELGETVVIDWGLAKVIGETEDAAADVEPDPATSLRTRIGSVFGTPGFMDPNQLRGDAVGPQGDVYSLGASLYNLLAAEPPHYSNDSTEMMKLAALGPATPIAQRVPGVPAELSTIVDTATDYDVARRYPDAGAFAEELKRFLAGQLVASHRYSKTERLVRFVRQHRAAVAIGSAATVLLIIVGAFAISQVLGERDRADDQRRAAEAARAMADERTEQLLISRASALVESNPTAALASLKQLSPKSKFVAEAQAILSSAQLRGVAWAMKADDAMSAVATLDQTGQRLAQMTTDGELHLYDLAARRVVFERAVERGSQVRWIDGGKFLLLGGRGETRKLDPAGVEQPSKLPPLLRFEPNEAGTVLVAIDTNRRAQRFDLERGTQSMLAEQATEVFVDPAGAHCAVITDHELLIFDNTNTVILRRKHERSIPLVTFAKTKVAVIDTGKIYQAELRAGASWHMLPYAQAGQNRPYWIGYHRERLFTTYTDSRLLAEWQGAMTEIGRTEANAGGMAEFADYLVVGSDGRRIYYVDGAGLRMLFLPIALRYVRIVARAGQRRVVAIGDGAIVVLDLDALPRLVETQRHQLNLFVSEREVLSMNGIGFDFNWYDLVTRKATTVKTGGPVQLRTFERETRRSLFVEQHPDGTRFAVYLVGDTQPTDVVSDTGENVQLIGGAVVYSRSNRVFGGMTGATRPELFTTLGATRILVRLSQTQFAAIADHEIVRYDLRTGALARVQLDRGEEPAYAISFNGDLVFGRGNQVYRWRSKLEVLATLEANVHYLVSTPHGVLASMTNHSAVFVDSNGKATRLASTRGGALVSPARIIVPGQFHYDVIELPSFARWSLPMVRASNMADLQLDLSPDGTQMIEKAFDGKLWLWQLPALELSEALAKTNLVEDRNGLLLWPWQAADPQK